MTGSILMHLTYLQRDTIPPNARITSMSATKGLKESIILKSIFSTWNLPYLGMKSRSNIVESQKNVEKLFPMLEEWSPSLPSCTIHFFQNEVKIATTIYKRVSLKIEQGLQWPKIVQVLLLSRCESQILLGSKLH
jgi:hypothetical protein